MDPAAFIDETISGYRDAMTLAHAVKCGLFECLADGPRTAAEVAADRGLDARAVGVVLASLAGAGFLSASGDRFGLVPELAPYLLADGASTRTSIIGHNLTLMRSWLQLDTVLATGEPAPRGERTAEELRDFICGMEDISRVSSHEVVRAVDLSGCRRLLDLGGGPGTASIVFAETHPDLECVVFDLPGAVAIGAERIAAQGLEDRIAVREGDFLTDDLGEGFDVVYMSNIIHMLGPDETATVLAAGRRALNPGGRVMIKDFFLADDGVTPAWVAQFSVNMLVNTPRGRSYRQSEMLQLIAAAGFGPVVAVPVGARSRVLIAERES